jgi:hypothetical protein
MASSGGPQGSKEYDVYVLVQRGKGGKKKYEIVVGKSFASAQEAARSAQVQVNKGKGKAIGIAADAIVCCKNPMTVPEEG